MNHFTLASYQHLNMRCIKKQHFEQRAGKIAFCQKLRRVHLSKPLHNGRETVVELWMWILTKCVNMQHKTKAHSVRSWAHDVMIADRLIVPDDATIVLVSVKDQAMKTAAFATWFQRTIPGREEKACWASLHKPGINCENNFLHFNTQDSPLNCHHCKTCFSYLI